MNIYKRVRYVVIPLVALWGVFLAPTAVADDPAPTIASVSPNFGYTPGGTEITVIGNNFINGASVSLGEYPNFISAEVVAYVDSTKIIVRTPASEISGPVSVVMYNPDGQRGVLSNGFIYGFPLSINGIYPNVGPMTGGTSVTIVGTNFWGGITAKIGGVEAAVNYVNDTQLSVMVPAGTAGAKDVEVMNPDGQRTVLANGFTYITPPTVTAIYPNYGTTTPGAKVSIIGSNFSANPVVKIGTSLMTVTSVSDTRIDGTIPAGMSGANDVVVTNADGQTATLTGGYRRTDLWQNCSVEKLASLTGKSLTTVLVDSGKGYLYGVSTITTPAQLVKYDLKTFTLVGTLNLPVGGQAIRSGAIDPVGGYALYATISYPSRIFRVNLKDFISVGTAALTIAESPVGSVLVDPLNGYAYFANAGLGSGTIFKYRIADLSRVGALALDNNEVNFLSGQIDPYHGFAYFGTGLASSMGRVIKVNLNNFTRVSSVDLKVDAIHPMGGITSSFLDADGGYGYFATLNPPAIAKVQLDNMTQVQVLSFNSKDEFPLNYAFADDQNGFGYVVSRDQSSRLIQFRLSDLARLGSFDLGANYSGGSSAFDPVGGYMYSAAANIQRLDRWSLKSKDCLYLTSIDPNSFWLEGGIDNMYFYGMNFVPGASVKFGATPSDSVRVDSPVHMYVSLPAGPFGPVDVTVTNPDGASAMLPQGFWYITTPAISSVLPALGPTSGGTSVTIKGQYFTPDATVTFGGTPAQFVTYIDSYTLTAVTPAQSAGVKDVAVTVKSAITGTLKNGFSFDESPVATSLSGYQAPVTGGTFLTIRGAHFTSGASVDFGGTPAPYINVIDDKTIHVIAPIHAVGIVNVTVTNPDGLSVLATNYFTYVAIDGSLAYGESLPIANSPVRLLLKDDLNNAVYIGSYTYGVSLGYRILKYDLNTYQVTGQLLLDASENSLISGVIDPASNLGYFATNQYPSTIIKVRLSDMTRVGKLTLQSGERAVCGVLDTKHGYIDFGTEGNPAKIVRVRLADFTRVDSISFLEASIVRTGVSDSSNEYAYFGSTGTINRLYKIRLSDLVVRGFKNITNSEIIGAGTIDPFDEYGYFTAFNETSYTSRILKVHLSDFVTAANMDFSSLNLIAYPVSLDPLMGYLYVGCTANPLSKVLQIRLVDFTKTAEVDLPSPSFITSSVLDSYHGFGLFGVGSGSIPLLSLPTLSPRPQVVRIYSVSPNSGPTAGGTVITIFGGIFQTGASVRIGGSLAANILVNDAHRITVTAPAGSAGAKDVVVTNPDGTYGTLLGGFTYLMPPAIIIGAVTVNSYPNSANILWATDQLADSQVEWGATTAYGNQTSLNSTQVSAHATMVTGLQPNMTYHYRVKSRNANGELTVSLDQTFQTLSINHPFDNGDWIMTYAEATRFDSCRQNPTFPMCPTTPFPDDYYTSALALYQGTPDGHFHYDGTKTGVQVWVPGLTPPPTPIISQIVSAAYPNSMVIRWTTDLPSTSQVEWGLTASYGSVTSLDSSLLTAHSVTLAGLALNKAYHFRVKSADGSGNLGVSPDQGGSTLASTFHPFDGNSDFHMTLSEANMFATCHQNPTAPGCPPAPFPDDYYTRAQALWSGTADGSYHYDPTQTAAQVWLPGAGELPAQVSDSTPLLILEPSVQDTQSPTVAIVSPADNAIVSGLITISAEAQDNVTVSKVQFFSDGAMIYENVAAPPYTVTLTLAPGTHTLSSKAFDPTGNIGLAKEIHVSIPSETAAKVSDKPKQDAGLFTTFANTISPSVKVMDISFKNTTAQPVTITVYSSRGEKVRELYSSTDHVTWDGKNDNGEDVPSGIYLVVLNINGQISRTKVSVVH